MGNTTHKEEITHRKTKNISQTNPIKEENVQLDLSDFRHNIMHTNTLKVDIIKDNQHKTEQLKLVMQTLEMYGQHNSIQTIQEESGIIYQDNQIIEFRSRIIEGFFEEAIQQVETYFNNTSDQNSLSLSEQQFKSIKYTILSQVQIEELLKSNYSEALEILRNRIVALEINESQTYSLTQLLVMDQEELNKTYSNTHYGRVKLLENIREVVPTFDILPENRMSTLINYSMNWQYQCCKNHRHNATLNVDYNMDKAKPTLLSDHICKKRNLTQQCIFTSDQEDEVWIVKISKCGQQFSLITRNSHLVTYKFNFKKENDSYEFNKLQNIVAHNEGVIFLNQSYDSNLMISGGEDKLIKVWNVKTGSLKVTLKHHTAQVNAAVFISNNSIASGGLDRYLYVVNLEGIVLFKKYNEKILDIIQNPLTKIIGVLPATTKNSCIKLQNIDKNFVEKSINEIGLVISIEFSSNGKHLISLLGSNSVNSAAVIHIWSIESKCVLGKQKGLSQSKFIMRAIFCGFEDSMIASSSEDSNIQLWERGNSNPVVTLEGHLGAVNSIDYSNKFCHLLASGSDDGYLNIYLLN